jgi:hypothetical protein
MKITVVLQAAATGKLELLLFIDVDKFMYYLSLKQAKIKFQSFTYKSNNLHL